MKVIQKGLLTAIFLLGALAGAQAKSKDWILYDFETDTEGWVNEPKNPIKPVHSTNEAHNGRGSLCCVYPFKKGKGVDTVDVQVKPEQPIDCSPKECKGLAAWIYVEKGQQVVASMYTQSGPAWLWKQGPQVTSQGKRWVQVLLPKSDIVVPSDVRCLGIYIYNSREGESPVYIDQIEAVGLKPPEPAANQP